MIVPTPAMRVAFDLAQRLPVRTVPARERVTHKELQGRPTMTQSAMIRAKLLAAAKQFPTLQECADFAGCSIVTARRHLRPKA